MDASPVVNFVSGHLDLTPAEFDAHYRPALDAALARGESFVVGDARGTDALTQNYLLGKTTAVVVYHMFTSPRHNAGFAVIGGFASDTERDERMTADSDQDIAWVRPGRQKSGTQKNIDRRKVSGPAAASLEPPGVKKPREEFSQDEAERAVRDHLLQFKQFDGIDIQFVVNEVPQGWSVQVRPTNSYFRRNRRDLTLSLFVDRSDGQVHHVPSYGLSIFLTKLRRE